MGNQWAGLKDKANFECIERSKKEKFQGVEVEKFRLSEDQLEKISKYWEQDYKQRFFRNSNPAQKLFGLQIEEDKG